MKSRAEIAIVAEGLSELADEVAFVGGAAIGLYIDDPGAPSPRITDDVDCVIQISTNSEYARLQERLIELRFQPDSSEGAPLCRWRYRGITVDVMPTDSKILSFTNRWYAEAMRYRRELRVDESLSVWGFTLPYLIATKLEAFSGRGENDWFASHDVEDIVALLDGALTAFAEIGATTGKLRHFLRDRFGELVKRSDSFEIVLGHVRPGPASTVTAERILNNLKNFSR